jgi:hypothetical protein
MNITLDVVVKCKQNVKRRKSGNKYTIQNQNVIYIFSRQWIVAWHDEENALKWQ